MTNNSENWYIITQNLKKEVTYLSFTHKYVSYSEQDGRTKNSLVHLQYPYKEVSRHPTTTSYGFT